MTIEKNYVICCSFENGTSQIQYQPTFIRSLNIYIKKKKQWFYHVIPYYFMLPTYYIIHSLFSNDITKIIIKSISWKSTYSF